MARPRRFEKKFSNTGLGQTPTVSELHGLLWSKTLRYWSKTRAELKERALAGDKEAARRYKYLLAATNGHATRSKKPVTRVKLKFLEEKDEKDA